MSDDRIYWYIPQRVVMLKALRDASLDVVRKDTKLVHEMVESGVEPVHLMMDVSDMGMIPADMEMTEEILSLFSSTKTGQTVMIGFHPQDMKMVKSARDAIIQITGKPIEFADSIAEALMFFKQHDPTLDV